MSVSADLLWGIIRNNSCHLVKASGQCYSKDPNNLKARNSFRYNGLVNRKTIGIEPAKDNKGVVVVTKKPRKRFQPNKTYTRVQMKRGGRKTLNSIRNFINNNNYRKDLKMAALRRASAILKSQKPVAVKRSVRKRKE